MPELPSTVFETARAMTRAVRRGTHADPEAIRERRENLLDNYDYAARVREDESGPVLVCYPAEWVEDGTFQPDQLDSTENAVEAGLYSAPKADGWEAIKTHNEELAETVAEQFGVLHGENASAFGTYMANHHESRIEEATSTDVERFLSEYFPRNAWPTPSQMDVVETSLERVFAVAGESVPLGNDNDATTGERQRRD